MTTGGTELEFTDGTRARVDVVPGLHLVIRFKNGYRAAISYVGSKVRRRLSLQNTNNVALGRLSVQPCSFRGATTVELL